MGQWFPFLPSPMLLQIRKLVTEMSGTNIGEGEKVQTAATDPRIVSKIVFDKYVGNVS